MCSVYIHSVAKVFISVCWCECRAGVEMTALVRKVKVIAEGLARHIYSLSDVVSQQNMNLAVGGRELRVNGMRP